MLIPFTRTRNFKYDFVIICLVTSFPTLANDKKLLSLFYNTNFRHTVWTLHNTLIFLIADEYDPWLKDSARDELNK